MIFVFSGTGNSYHVSKRMASALEMDLVEMSSALKYKRSFYNAEGKAIGFVFPVYYSGLPKAVEEFLEIVEIRNPGYVYAVSTCAGESGRACEQLQDMLEKKLKVDAFYDVLMPENAVFYEDVPGKDEAERINADADMAIDSIIGHVRVADGGDFRTMAGSGDFEKARELYEESRSTEPFTVNDDCIGCGICELVCMAQIIKVYHRKPVWDEPQCNMCMACLNMCPKRAIDFGDVTKSRGRYFHPDYYMWSLGVRPPCKREDFQRYDSGMRY